PSQPKRLDELIGEVIERTSGFDDFVHETIRSLNAMRSIDVELSVTALVYWMERKTETEKHPREAAAYDMLGLFADIARDLMNGGSNEQAMVGFRGVEQLAIALHDRRMHTTSLNEQGHLARRQGDADLGLALYKRALDMARETDDIREIATYCYNLAIATKESGDTETALALLTEAEPQLRRVRDR